MTKKIFLSLLIVMFFAPAVFALQNPAAPPILLYTTTILNCTVEQVQDTLVDKMTARGFTINEVTPYKVVFSKSIQDFFRVLRNTVTFNLMPRDGNIKMMTTQQVSLGSQVEDRPITELIPVIKEVRNSIDGTKLDNIENEAVIKSPETQNANMQEKKLGIILIKSEVDGHFRIKEILAKSAAADAGLAVNDEILEINGKVLAELDKNAVDAYISNKWAEGSSLIILYSRNGEQKIIKLKKGGY